MPGDFFCESCKLGFSVGWFHYHGDGEGYGAETLLVCSACGTTHMIQHPTPIKVPVLGGLFFKTGKPAKTDRLMAQSGPGFLEGAEQDVLRCLKEWHECKVSHELRPKYKHSSLKNYLELGPIECHHCGRKKTVTSDWNTQIVRCPARGQPKLLPTKGWIT